MKAAFLMVSLAIFAGPAIAAGTHAGGHGEYMAGEPGALSEVNRSIEIEMRETDDGEMIFQPAAISVRAGETIRFIIKNAGELEHEFVVDHHDKMMEHKELMQRFPEMEHDDPNAIRLSSASSGEIIWKFSNTGNFEFGCLLPGHYEAGMKGSILVAAH
ncbi:MULTISPECIES: cupredoxin domain-containing protein [Nitratireductor]|uniref:Blue (Type1) copper domain-containing protein n=1 Tax=Nitratireductor basaltis TaxID=472175 RepID=A0A084U9H1_9HYPH|nr:plastocyanin/azurin family copper-binding protein [Nitratireductor basaltis]KFB09607.1 Blue (Type1) copper domain-containing protein [Nitratireductor basaltis]